jgi:hypothetical protein
VERNLLPLLARAAAHAALEVIEFRKAGDHHRMGAVPRPRFRSDEAAHGLPHLIDLKNIYCSDELERKGFLYVGIGRAVPGRALRL